MYALFISILSPFILLFFRYALGARHEDLLWDDRPEYKALYDRKTKELDSRTMMQWMEETVGKFGGYTALAWKPSRTTVGPWEKWTFEEYWAEANVVAKGLLHFAGLEKGKGVAILSGNNPFWNICALGAAIAGGIPVGLYQTTSASSAKFILNHCEAQVVIVENEMQLSKIKDIKHELDHVKLVIVLLRPIEEEVNPDGTRKRRPSRARRRGSRSRVAVADQTPMAEGFDAWSSTFSQHCMHYDTFLRKTRDLPASKLATLAGELRDNGARSSDILTLIYTSGTTGRPKGVIITHSNAAHAAYAIISYAKICPDDHMISYLPLSHVAEQLISVWAPTMTGHCTYFAAGDALRGSLVRTMRQVRKLSRTPPL